jgi:prophage regulatory protein
MFRARSTIVSSSWITADQLPRDAGAAPQATTSPNHPAPITWVSPKWAAEMLDLSEATIWRWLKTRPDFPRPVKLSPGCTRFKLQDLLDFVASMEAGK